PPLLRPPPSPLSPYTTLFRSHSTGFANRSDLTTTGSAATFPVPAPVGTFLGHQDIGGVAAPGGATFDASSGTYTVNTASYDIWRSEEHMSELQSRVDLVCRLL